MESVLSLPEDVFTPQARRIQRDLSSLSSDSIPKFQALIEGARRVGYNLEVRETLRTQERQAWLYRQGRDSEGREVGQVVTWTLQSKHKSGRAVDFFVNGDPSGTNPGYRWIHSNARRYGLHALGPKDPGHVEDRGSPMQRGIN